ncbi:hypothetical protein KP509_02G054800 [Ceratopteris richardii]|nr:hypothetical protein KP509_02G054800 [Ceratopteris richardii]
MRISSIRFLPNGQLVEAQGFPQERLPAGTASSFLFPYAVLERLREKASHSLTDKGKQCSRYQALVGLLWKARARSLLAMAGNSLTQEFNLRFPVNLRDRGIPGLDRHYSGNSVFQLAIRGTLQELCENPLEKLVKKLQSVMKSIDFPECAQSLTDYIELKMQEGLTPDIDRPCLAVVALFGLPFYDTDCGWGRPIFCGLPSRQLATRVTILDHPTAAAWNVLTVLNSQEEYTAFVQQIEEYTLS